MTEVVYPDMVEEFTPISVRKGENLTICPTCGSDKTSSDNFWKWNNRACWETAWCEVCGSYWSNIFTFLGVSTVTQGPPVNRKDMREKRYDVERAERHMPPFVPRVGNIHDDGPENESALEP